eukprot:s3515_g3.t1
MPAAALSLQIARQLRPGFGRRGSCLRGIDWPVARVCALGIRSARHFWPNRLETASVCRFGDGARRDAGSARRHGVSGAAGESARLAALSVRPPP